jgi:hypothetical protein
MSDSNKFGQLARQMAYNHLCLSLTAHDDEPSAYLKGRLPLQRKIVVVVGAGASNDACGLPTGPQAQTRLIRSFLKSGLVKDQLITGEISRIAVEYRLDQHDFEAALLALSKFDQPTVLKELNAVYNRRHYPSFTYEILAHWLKHRFIDAIVNFNFDELLDQAIDDELGEDGYYRVVTDGDCPQKIDDWLDDKQRRFDFPLYVKPHGTASHKSTMRFTRASYSLLSTEVVGLLTKLFSQDVDLLVLGHAMQSVEFNAILHRNRERIAYFTIGRSKPVLRGPAGLLPQAFRSCARRGLTDCVKELSRDVNRSFRKQLNPRSVGRHELIADLFKRQANLRHSDDTRRWHRRRYLADRIYVEIALAVAKAKGFLSFEHLVGSRAGYYFKKLRRYTAKQRATSKRRWRRAEPASLLEFCEKLELGKFGASQDTVALKTRRGPELRLRQPILSEQEFKAAAPKLARRMCQLLSPERQARCKGKRKELIRALVEMYNGDEVEASPKARTSPDLQFTHPTVLPTLTSLHARTRKLMRSGRWDAILCTAESGEWLRRWKSQIKNRRAKIAVVVADETHSGNLQRDLGTALVGEQPRWLPWWLHNRHVTVFVQRKKVVGAIFFERRLRSGHIVPLWLTGNDAEMAKNAFVTYWIKALGSDSTEPDPEIKADQIELAWAELLKALYPRRRARSRR